jgi:hypothetical protein
MNSKTTGKVVDPKLYVLDPDAAFLLDFKNVLCVNANFFSFSIIFVKG